MNIDTIQSDGSLVPPLRWAGGKRWLVQRFPNLFDGLHGRLIEPFFGSGAVFFRVAPESAVVSDINDDLITAYRGLRNCVTEVESCLSVHAKLHSKPYYYEVRKSKPTNISERSARMIYLNRVCFNALYRVNLSGEFNVPIGSKTAVYRDDDNFPGVSRALRKAVLVCCDFEETINQAEVGDVIFVDPPYTVKHNKNGFLKYNEKIFTFDDQIRLAGALFRAKGRGARIIISNAFHQSVLDLYEGFGFILEVSRSTTLSAASAARGMTSEALIFSENFRDLFASVAAVRGVTPFEKGPE